MKITDKRGNEWYITNEVGEAQKAQREMRAEVNLKEYFRKDKEIRNGN